jgi:cobalt-zinc-cadmium efflux system membrane fusion protein
MKKIVSSFDPKYLKPLALFLGIGLFLFIAVKMFRGQHQAGHGDHGTEAAEEKPRGPHGGRFFGDRDFQCEVTIYEPEGVPPEFRVYFYRKEKPLNPGEAKLVITLERINRIDTINFRPQEDYLIGDQTVVEPHSFHATVDAQYQDKAYQWKFDSIEGRTEMGPEAVTRSKIEMLKAGPQKIREILPLRGSVTLNGDHTAQAIARFPGVIKELPRKMGEIVQKGDVLAVIESHQSLQTYVLRAEVGGMIVQRNATLGESVDSQKILFVVSDLSSVWVDFSVYQRDALLVRAGQPVSLEVEGVDPVETKLDQVSPAGVEGSQTALARSVVPNPDGILRPGMFVLGKITTGETDVPVAVKAGALQTFRDWDVVFIRVGNLFEAVPIEIGRRDPEWVEVKEGLPEGSEYAAENSFIIKADVMKSGATHDH